MARPDDADFVDDADALGGKPDGEDNFNEPRGAKVFPFVSVGVYRTPDLVSSVTWFHSRQAITIVPNNIPALGDGPSFTAYKVQSGLGWLRLEGEKR
jgi:hypothetical protein